MHLIKKQLLIILTTVLCMTSFATKPNIHQLPLENKIAAKMAIKSLDTNFTSTALSLEITIENLTHQTLKYQRKAVDIMIGIVVYDKHGLTLNRAEIKIDSRARHSKVMDLHIPPKSTVTFDRNYLLQDYFSSKIERKAVFLQAYIVLSKSDNKRIEIGSIKSNKIEINRNNLAK